MVRKLVVSSKDMVEQLVRALWCSRGKGASMYYALVESGGAKKLDELKWRDHKDLEGHMRHMRSCLPFLKKAGLVGEKDNKLFYFYEEIQFRVGENLREWKTIDGIPNILSFVRKLAPPKKAFEKLENRKYRYILKFG